MLYSTTSAPNLLRHHRRASILTHLHHSPGATLTDLCRATAISWGAVHHHLHHLRRAGLVEFVRDGRTRRVFPAALEADVRAALAALSSSRARRLAELISAQASIRQIDILRRLGMSRKVFRHQVEALKRLGLVVENSTGRGRFYNPGPRLPGLLGEPAPAATTRESGSGGTAFKG